MRIKDKVAVITGGNSGIGYAIGEALAREGAHLIIAGRRQTKSKEVAARFSEQYGVRVRAIEADVSRESDCVQLYESAQAELGKVDLAVNNAGIGGGGTLAETTTETFDAIIKTNLYGTFWCARAAFQCIQRNPLEEGVRGAIINVSSIAGKEAWSGTGTYSASKFGMIALTQAMADEGKVQGIKAAALCPARVATPMTGVSGPEYLQPSDCAESVLYLLRLSPAAWPTEVVLPRRDAD